MSEQNPPEGMITVEDYAKQKGLTPEKVVAMIKDGICVGRVIDEQWYVNSSEFFGERSSSKRKSGIVYRSEYETARKISMLISFLGWLVFASGVIAALAGMGGGLRSDYGGGISIIAFLPGLGIAVSGLFLVAAGQVTKATVDNADHTREILSLIREKA